MCAKLGIFGVFGGLEAAWPPSMHDLHLRHYFFGGVLSSWTNRAYRNRKASLMTSINLEAVNLKQRIVKFDLHCFRGPGEVVIAARVMKFDYVVADKVFYHLLFKFL